VNPSDWTLPAILGVALGALALLLALGAWLRTARLRRAVAALDGQGDGATLLETVGRHRAEVSALRTEVTGLARDTAALRVDLGDAIRHLSVVRYDAFGDMGGRMSFSLALLDDGGDGVVLTSIAGRTESRTYARGVKGGRSDSPLAPEEEQAIRYASGQSAKTGQAGRRDGGDS
jgi:hypothetical protein